MIVSAKNYGFSPVGVRNYDLLVENFLKKQKAIKKHERKTSRKKNVSR